MSITPLFALPPDSPASIGSAARVQYVVPDPDASGRLFINDANGVLYTTPSAGQTPTPYLDLRTRNVGFLDLAEQDGFSGVAFNPNFNGDPAKPGYGVFYTLASTATTGAPLTYLTNDAASHTTTLREWTAADPKAATFAGTSRVVMTIGDATGGHNGGTIAFNPTAVPGSPDYGKLYIGMGDDGFNDPQRNGQNLGTPRGKILRIDPAQGPGGQPYTVPADNPFVGQAGAVPEVWAYGLRNPQSFGWDSGTGTMYINDIGQAPTTAGPIGRARSPRATASATPIPTTTASTRPRRARPPSA